MRSKSQIPNPKSCFGFSQKKETPQLSLLIQFKVLLVMPNYRPTLVLTGTSIYPLRFVHLRFAGVFVNELSLNTLIYVLLKAMIRDELKRVELALSRNREKRVRQVPVVSLV